MNGAGPEYGSGKTVCILRSERSILSESIYWCWFSTQHILRCGSEGNTVTCSHDCIYVYLGSLDTDPIFWEHARKERFFSFKSALHRFTQWNYTVPSPLYVLLCFLWGRGI